MHQSLCPITKTATPVFIRVAWFSSGALDMSPCFNDDPDAVGPDTILIDRSVLAQWP